MMLEKQEYMEKNVVGHFLLTRFNVRINTVLTNQLEKIDITSDNNYLTERFRLFFKYTVPSVLAQSDQDFEWIILFSDNTPEKFKEKASKIKGNGCKVTCLYVSDETDYLDVLNEYLVNKGYQWYITSRVDNDDAIEIDYIRDVKKKILSEGKTVKVLSFNNGIQYEERTGFLTRYPFPSNHFTSMLSPWSNRIDNIISHGHMEIAEEYPVININNSVEMWLEVVHESNVTNRMHFKKGNRITDIKIFDKYGLQYSELKLVDKNEYLAVCLQGPKNVIRLLRQYGLLKTIKKGYNKFSKIRTKYSK